MKIKLFTIPNIITLLNLLSGTAGIVLLFTADPSVYGLQLAFYCVIISAVLDFFDGFAARMLRQHSLVGIQLDSLADMVSFGVLPGLVMYRMFVFSAPGIELWGVLVLTVVAASALRLAKFNIDDSQTTEFEGLPTPANALLIGSLGYVFCGAVIDGRPECTAEWIPWAIIGLSLALSWLLVSPVKMFSLKFKNFGLRGNELRYIFLASALALLLLFGLSGVWIIVALYIATSFIRWTAAGRGGRK